MYLVIKNALTRPVHYLPKLLINNVLVPCIKKCDSFCYLGRYLNFEMSNQAHKSELTTLVNDMMSDIDLKPLHPKNKLLLYSRYVLSNISWHLTFADLSKTWITEYFDSTVNQFIRKWTKLHFFFSASGCHGHTRDVGVVLCTNKYCSCNG